jgi:hypothetical protein
MSIQQREIPLAEWSSFLDQFSHDHRAWMARIERTVIGGGAPLIESRRFVGARAEIENDGPRVIALRFHQETDGSARLRVAGPKTLRAEETPDGAVQGIEIETHGGERIRLHFRGVARPDILLDGLAPGELT